MEGTHAAIIHVYTAVLAQVFVQGLGAQPLTLLHLSGCLVVAVHDLS